MHIKNVCACLSDGSGFYLFLTESSISSVSSLTSSDSANFLVDDKSLQELTDVAESTWWFKSFFHSEPVLSNVKSQDPSASG
ncbi:pancreatic progenitor cell differentiation and proliferation factor-like protein [Nannospalax galili]|uniref:pancreatic progenitor cell differentiation and proliferation factor-like protein n=1 Tax=Nannospalax galili TaxID=1026970 RepID=UPI00111C0B62|nr:pancreatic progenitor cell differentiation and proliferation factor-like protein [Nannospalax galili]